MSSVKVKKECSVNGQTVSSGFLMAPLTAGVISLVVAFLSLVAVSGKVPKLSTGLKRLVQSKLGLVFFFGVMAALFLTSFGFMVGKKYDRMEEGNKAIVGLNMSVGFVFAILAALSLGVFSLEKLKATGKYATKIVNGFNNLAKMEGFKNPRTWSVLHVGFYLLVGILGVLNAKLDPVCFRV